MSGEGGIRTPGTVASTPHFECGPFDHSGTSPDTTKGKECDHTTILISEGFLEGGDG